MATFNVTQSNDDGTGSVENTLSWAIMQANDETTSAGADTISIDVPIVTIDGVMKTLINSDITINGNGNTVDGDSNDDGDGFRPFFVLSGTVVFNNLTITDGIAEGGSSRFGGGGAGMGGGLFIYGGDVSLNSVIFDGNIAQGGSSAISGLSGGGGGMFGDGGGDGGGGLFASSMDDTGAYGGNGNYGGGSGGFGNGGSSDDGGFGGGGGYRFVAGNGGFGGGGGNGVVAQGFGFTGGLGGFGGGGNGLFGDGGFGGGDGSGAYGGGGAGMGGAVFIRSGTLTVTDSTFTNNYATGGSGARSGQGLGGAIFSIIAAATNLNDNNQGMPDTLPSVTVINTSFSNNDAADPANDNDQTGIGENLNNDAVFGTIECFLTGSHILTDRGEVPVEDLKIDDLIQTVGGSLKPIKWIGNIKLN